MCDTDCKEVKKTLEMSHASVVKTAGLCLPAVRMRVLRRKTPAREAVPNYVLITLNGMYMGVYMCTRMAIEARI